MRLIDVDKLWTDIKEDVAPFTVGMISRHIHNACSIDPVHAAGACYCRECEEYETCAGETWCVMYMVRMNPDDFCSHGKPKEETNNE